MNRVNDGADGLSKLRIHTLCIFPLEFLQLVEQRPAHLQTRQSFTDSGGWIEFRHQTAIS